MNLPFTAQDHQGKPILHARKEREMALVSLGIMVSVDTMIHANSHIFSFANTKKTVASRTSVGLLILTEIF